MKQIALLASVVAALAGAALFWVYKSRFEAEVSGGAPVSVTVAKVDLDLGDRLSADNLVTRMIPESYVDRRHIRAAEVKQVLGTRVRTQIRAGESVLWSDLATFGANARDLAGLVMPGMRAMAIPASNLLTFEGLLRPGDRIDVLFSVVDPRSQRPVTIPLMQNLIVLAVGSHIGQVTSKTGNYSYATVTVAVKPEQAQVLASAMNEGRLNIVLRNTEDIRLLDTGTPQAGGKSGDAKKK